MTTILNKIKQQVSGDQPPTVAQVFNQPQKDEHLAPDEVIVQQLATAKTLKVNNPGMPAVGFTMETLGQEFGLVVEKAMQQAQITSVNAEIFGIFDQLGIVPRGFVVHTDENINQRFYVLRNANRMSDIFKRLAKAIGSTAAEVISFPYTFSTNLELPLKYEKQKEDYKMVKIEVTSLYLNQQEIEKLNYAFIKEVQYCEKLPHQENAVDLLAFKIDREEWASAPYRI